MIMQPGRARSEEISRCAAPPLGSQSACRWGLQSGSLTFFAARAHCVRSPYSITPSCVRSLFAPAPHTPPRPHPMLRQASTIAYYTLLEALRNRLMWLLGLVLVIGIGLSGFLSDLAVTEQKETQVALLAAFLRFTAVFLMVIFVVTSLVREANDKGLELVLALPLPRAGYVLGKLAGFALLALLPALLFGGLMGLLVQTWDAALWTASLLAELWIVAAFSLLCVMTFQQVMTALSAAMGFYLLARSVTALQQFGQSRYAPDGPSQQVINAVMQGVGYVLPRLDDFTRTDWLVYHSGSWATLGPLAAQTLIYLALLTAAALFDLYRRNL